MRKMVIAAIATALTATAASAGSPSLAAPGDCAQPIRNPDTGPVGRQAATSTDDSGSVSGPPVDVFAPIPIVSDVVAAPTNVIDAIAAWIAPSTTDSATAAADAPSLSFDAGALQVNTGSLPLAPVVAPSLQVDPGAVVPPPVTPVLNAAPVPLVPTITSSPATITVAPILGDLK